MAVFFTTNVLISFPSDNLDSFMYISGQRFKMLAARMPGQHLFENGSSIKKLMVKHLRFGDLNCSDVIFIDTRNVPSFY